VDIRGQSSQHVDELRDVKPDLVVTVCDHAAERCPVFPGATRVVHRAFPDPAAARGSEEEVLSVFREVRDQIRRLMSEIPELLAAETTGGSGVEGASPSSPSPGEGGTLRRWDRADRGDVADYGVFRVRRYLSRSPRTGKSRKFSVIETRDWVNVIAVTPEDEVVLVRQFRQGSGTFTLEIPGGMVDAQEDPRDAAARELLEETGYAGRDPEFLGTVEPNPAILDNRCHTYLVRDCRRVAQPRLDAGEDIEVTRLPRAELPGAVADGRIAHSLVICAFWWLSVNGGGFGPGGYGSGAAG
jgi:8-oxo-dGTP pyrophosphatase MutT (NUDIX family)